MFSTSVQGSDGNNYELICNKETGTLLSKKNGILWIDYSGNPLVQGLFDKVKQLEYELKEVDYMLEQLRK